jgi:prolyl oligopeptidase
MRLVIAAAMALLAAPPALAQVQLPSIDPKAPDPFGWLEDIHSPRSLAWVEGENKLTAARLEGDHRFQTFHDQALALFTSKDRIPTPRFRGDGVDNLWQDGTHPHGLWRHATLASYRTATPAWRTLIDLDALSKAEGKSFFFKGAECLAPEERLCLVNLSNGGGDAVEVREFDTASGKFVEGGFHLPVGKHRLAWEDENTLLVATDFGPGTLTKAGYPYILKRLKRGQSLDRATEVFRGSAGDVGYGLGPRALRDKDGKLVAVLIDRTLDTFRSEHWLLQGDAKPVKLGLPAKVGVHGLFEGRLIVTLNEDWKGVPGGVVVAPKLADLISGLADGPSAVLFRPSPRQGVNGVEITRTRVVVNYIEDVKARLASFRYQDGWKPTPLTTPDNLAVDLVASHRENDDFFYRTESFLLPPTLMLANAATGKAEVVKSLPALFDGSKDVVEQHFATSKDGTKVPYFLVRLKGMKLDGTTPTVMFGYGGFLISETPSYRPEVGKLWLERGGAYVLANIRGGGEYGPKWHEAALRENRQRAFDDFDAIALDLFKRKVTSPRRFGIYARSNGGVLTTVSMTQHPDHFNAVVVESPLIDMLRYNKLSAGASWMAEYGDPDKPEDRAFIAKYSAYTILKPGMTLPEPYITTNTEDDRVHPGHPRKFAAELKALGYPYMYYENTFGGHANDADPELNARRWARHYVYLSQKLMD